MASKAGLIVIGSQDFTSFQGRAASNAKATPVILFVSVRISSFRISDTVTAGMKSECLFSLLLFPTSSQSGRRVRFRVVLSAVGAFRSRVAPDPAFSDWNARPNPSEERPGNTGISLDVGLQYEPQHSPAQSEDYQCVPNDIRERFWNRLCGTIGQLIESRRVEIDKWALGFPVSYLIE